jgi:hypothetical protein
MLQAAFCYCKSIVLPCLIPLLPDAILPITVDRSDLSEHLDQPGVLQGHSIHHFTCIRIRQINKIIAVDRWSIDLLLVYTPVNLFSDGVGLAAYAGLPSCLDVSDRLEQLKAKRVSSIKVILFLPLANFPMLRRLSLLKILVYMLAERAKKMAEEARRKRMWLYDPKYKRWYSPEDFEHIFSYANATDEFLETLQVRHPAEGIAAGFKQLAQLQTRLQAFCKTVMEYYK